MEKTYLTLEEAALELGVHRSTIYRLGKRGAVTIYLLGDGPNPRKYVKRTELLALINPAPEADDG